MPEDDIHSVFREPHLRPEAARPDPSERRAERALRKEADEDAPPVSIYDEPAVFPGQRAGTIEQDWSCSRCGYNLRGLPAGHPCPECGHVELYRPPPRDAPGYAAWLRARMQRTSVGRSWRAALLAALLGGPWAVLAALWNPAPGGPLAGGPLVLVVLFGPAIEEVMKVAAAAWLIETRPYLFRSRGQVLLAGAGAALVFAAIENVLYLTVYVPTPGPWLALWRWTVCVAMHVGCSLVAARGLAAVWERTMRELRPPELSRATPALGLAIVLHGSYNLAVSLWEML